MGGKHNNDQLLYQDILLYSTINGTFRFSELGQWLVRNNREMLSYYDSTSSKKNTPYARRVHGQTKRIQNKLDDLVGLKLIDVKEPVEARKNKMIGTPSYSSTKPGYLLRWLIKAKDEEYSNYSVTHSQFTQNIENKNYKINSSQSKKEFATIQQILDIIDFYSKINDSYSLAFVNKFCKKCNEKGNFIHIIAFFMETILPRYNISNGRDLVVLFTGLRHSLNWILADPHVFYETLDGLDEEAKKVLLYQFKMEIEEYHHQNYLVLDLPALEFNTKPSPNHSYSNTLVVPGKEWQVIRFNNIADHSKVTIPAYCETCKSDRSFIIDISAYLKSITYAHNTSKTMVSGKCSKCSNFIGTHTMRLSHSGPFWL